MWASLGLLIVAFWQLYASAAAPIPISAAEPLWTFARLTCPILLIGSYFHFGISIYWVLLANAATYALVGLMVEALRQNRNSFKTVQ
jgi:hypothetical protein